jgi:NAD(P)-dependent dehydrogenase (short-subunit alcohol dehydrogenase family)
MFKCADRLIVVQNAAVSYREFGTISSHTNNVAAHTDCSRPSQDLGAPHKPSAKRVASRTEPDNSASQPTMKKATVKDVVDAVLYLVQADHVNGEILHVDGATLVTALHVNSTRPPGTTSDE